MQTQFFCSNMRHARSFSVLAIAVTLVAGWAFGPAPSAAAPGDPVAVVTVPVPSPSGIGVSIASSCDRILFYTNYQSPFLHKTNKFGANLGSLPLTDAATGGALTLGEMSWDNLGGQLWAGTDNQDPIKVYTINPATGVATFRFALPPGIGIALVDGLAYDAGDNTLWISPDVSTQIFHFTTTGVSLGAITPTDAGGNVLGGLSGTAVGLGNTLYLGRNGFGEIVRVNKTTGAFISIFSTPGGRDEGLECDQFSFEPLSVLWSKDAFNNTVTAIEVEPRTCACGGVVPTVPATWGRMKSVYR